MTKQFRTPGSWDGDIEEESAPIPAPDLLKQLTNPALEVVRTSTPRPSWIARLFRRKARRRSEYAR